MFQTSTLQVVLGLPKWVPNVLLRKHAGVPSFAGRIIDLVAGLSYISVNSWSPLWKFQDGNLVPLTGNLPCISEVLDEIVCHPEYLPSFSSSLKS